MARHGRSGQEVILSTKSHNICASGRSAGLVLCCYKLKDLNTDPDLRCIKIAGRMRDDLLVSCRGRAGVSHVLMPHIKLTFRPKSLYTFFFWRGPGGQRSGGPVPDNIPTAGAGRAAAGAGRRAAAAGRSSQGLAVPAHHSVGCRPRTRQHVQIQQRRYETPDTRYN